VNLWCVTLLFIFNLGGLRCSTEYDLVNCSEPKRLFGTALVEAKLTNNFLCSFVIRFNKVSMFSWATAAYF